MLKVIKYYANNIACFGKMYGDIDTDPDSIRKDHPDSEIITGYGVVNTETGISPDDSDDWYWTYDEAQKYIDQR